MARELRQLLSVGVGGFSFLALFSDGSVEKLVITFDDPYNNLSNPEALYTWTPVALPPERVEHVHVVATCLFHNCPKNRV